MISAFSIIKNEEHNLPKMFNDMRDYVDEFIIIDQESEDKSVAICEANGAKISREFCVGYSEPYYEKAKSMCQHDWLLLLFPDEVWHKDSLEKARILGNEPVGEEVCHAFRRDEYTDDTKWDMHGHPNFILRLMPKKYARFSDLAHNSFLFPRKIIHHELFIDHRKSKQERCEGQERFDIVYQMLILRYKNSKDPWVKMWLERYKYELERTDAIKEGKYSTSVLP